MPHLPSLEINENAIDRLVRIYVSQFRNTKKYLTDSGHVDFKEVGSLLRSKFLFFFADINFFKLLVRVKTEFLLRDLKRTSVSKKKKKPVKLSRIVNHSTTTQKIHSPVRLLNHF